MKERTEGWYPASGLHSMGDWYHVMIWGNLGEEYTLENNFQSTFDHLEYSARNGVTASKRMNVFS